MVSSAACIVAAAACFFLAASAVWANHRFADFETLPRQFGPTLQPKAYGPRWMMIWAVPATMIGMLCLLIALPNLVPPENFHGDASLGVMIAGPITVSAQVFILWLLTR